MSKLEEAEKKEREVITRLMKVLKPKAFSLTEIGSGEAWDFTMTYGVSRSYIGEMKCLTCDSMKYDSMLLEVKKAKGLAFEAYKRGNMNPILYCMHYTDNVVRILKITPQLLNFYEPEWVHAAGRNKSVYFIPITDAHKIEL